jgi:hypothetical protein
MGARISDWIGLLFVLTIVYVLVRPRSKTAELVESVGAMITAMVRRATDVAQA